MSPGAGTPPLVLLVDDYEDNRRLSAEYLELSGFRTPVAGNGEEGLAIALTAYPIGYSRHAAMEAGCDAYLTKPCGPRQLLAEIRRLLDARGGPDPGPLSAGGPLRALFRPPWRPLRDDARAAGRRPAPAVPRP